jgi:putative spermidine/putrescine transport system permease protein
MNNATVAEQPTVLTSADGTPLDVALAKATRRAKWRAFALVLPLLLFIVVTFAIPIAQMLQRSFHNDAFSANMPNVGKFFKDNPELVGVPDEAGFEALVQDLISTRKAKTIGMVSTRVNYEVPGARSQFTKTARRAAKLEAPFKEALIDIDKDWDDPLLWNVMKRASNPYGASFYLAALDMKYDENGKIVRAEEKKRVYVNLFYRTLWLSALISVLCFVLAFPVAHLLATLPLRYSNLLMIFVLLPFWTSLLVRTTAWIALLQGQGVVNDVLVTTGVINDESRLEMMYNQTGTIIAMTHILLPFMVLPLYSVMKTIPPTYVRAARSLGASSWTAFWKVYFPQTMPGIGAGFLLVFILAVGYYITPALVGGSSGQLISNLIAFHMLKSLNWSLAAALGGILLFIIIVLYWLYDKLIGIDNMKLG